MSFPVVATLTRNFRRVGTDWPVIWHFLQVPLLFAGLIVCTGLAVVTIVGTDPFFNFDSTDEKRLHNISGWFFTFQFVAGYGISLLMVPFYISWIRFAASGAAAVESRPVWALGRDEWRFIGRFLLFMLYILGFMIAAICVAVAVSAAGTFFSKTIDSALLNTFLIVIGFVAATVGYIYFFGFLLRLSAVIVPIAFGLPLDLRSALQATRGIAWKLGGILFLISLIFLMPWAVTEFAVISDGDSDVYRRLLKIQLLQPLILQPLSIFMGIVWCGIYADVWRRPEVRHEWPVPEFPLSEN